jgi:hypothetical protein
VKSLQDGEIFCSGCYLARHFTAKTSYLDTSRKTPAREGDPAACIK